MDSHVPVKSQSLHNFALPLWNWSKSQSNPNHHQRPRKSSKSSKNLDLSEKTEGKSKLLIRFRAKNKSCDEEQRSEGSGVQEVKRMRRPVCKKDRLDSEFGQKKEGPLKVIIPLSKEEIEEDIFVMTGSKPSRRPKKRARIVQKQLDNIFPGLWLDTITPDSYRVPEFNSKG